MTMSAGTLPFDVNELGSGAIRVIVQPISTALSKALGGWFGQVAPYAPVGAGALDLGATSGPATYDRAITVAGLKIEQQLPAVLERVTDVTRQMVIPMANINGQNLQVFENATQIIAVAAAAGVSMAAVRVPIGSFTDLVQYRMMFVGQKVKGQGIVTEPTTLLQRGRFDAVLAYRVQLTAATGQMSFGQGNLISMPVTVKLFPEPGEPQGEEYGSHIHEAAGTM